MTWMVLVVFCTSAQARESQGDSHLSGQLYLRPQLVNVEAKSGEVNWQKQLQLILQARASHIQRAVTQLPLPEEVQFHGLLFEKTRRRYLLDLSAAGDRFTLFLEWENPERLHIGVENNWIPADWVLGTLKDKLQAPLATLNTFGIASDMLITHNTRKQNVLRIHFNPRQQERVSGYFNAEGDVFLNVNAHIIGAAPARLQVSAAVPNPLSETFALDIEHQLHLDLSPEVLQNISLANESLSHRVERLQGVIAGQAHFLGDFRKGRWDGVFQADFPTTQFKSHTYTQFKSYPFVWQFDVPYQNYSDFQVRPQWPPLTSEQQRLKQLPFHKGRLQYTIDGPDYVAALRAAVQQATQQVQQEVFVFYEGKSTQSLARLYLLKAMGLKEESTGRLIPDPLAPEGISIHLLHNHALGKKDPESVRRLFLRAQEKILEQLSSLRKNTAFYGQRAQKHLQIRALNRGIVKIDHRKQIIIDHQMAFVGGFNLGDHYLTRRGFHDIMYQVSGPVVRELEQAFVENWDAAAQTDPFLPATPTLPQQSAPGAFDFTRLKRSHAREAFYPHMALLLHDHDKNTLRPAILGLINNAKHTLRIEQAYFNHPQITDALKAAKSRGVNIEMVMSYYNDEGMFERLNLVNMLELQQAPGAGKVSVWLYRGYNKAKPADRKNPAYMVHTKYISADEKEAIVGSTNLIPRSLQSPFYGLHPRFYKQAPVFFNEEIGLWLKDRETVTALDHDLIKRDQRERSVEYTPEDLLALIEARGGKWKVFIDRLKGLLS